MIAFPLDKKMFANFKSRCRKFFSAISMNPETMSFINLKVYGYVSFLFFLRWLLRSPQLQSSVMIQQCEVSLTTSWHFSILGCFSLVNAQISQSSISRLTASLTPFMSMALMAMVSSRLIYWVLVSSLVPLQTTEE